RAISAFFIVMLAVTVFYFKYSMPILWIAFASITVILFFNSLPQFVRKWDRYPEKIFKKKLFKQAFIIRAIVVTFLYIFFQLRYGHPFEYEAADSLMYDN